MSVASESSAEINKNHRQHFHHHHHHHHHHQLKLASRKCFECMHVEDAYNGS